MVRTLSASGMAKSRREEPKPPLARKSIANDQSGTVDWFKAVSNVLLMRR